MTFPSNFAPERFERLYEKFCHEWFEAELDELIQLYPDHRELLIQGYRFFADVSKNEKGGVLLEIDKIIRRMKKVMRMGVFVGEVRITDVKTHPLPSPDGKGNKTLVSVWGIVAPSWQD